MLADQPIKFEQSISCVDIGIPNEKQITSSYPHTTAAAFSAASLKQCLLSCYAIVFLMRIASSHPHTNTAIFSAAILTVQVPCTRKKWSKYNYVIKICTFMILTSCMRQSNILMRICPDRHFIISTVNGEIQIPVSVIYVLTTEISNGLKRTSRSFRATMVKCLQGICQLIKHVICR